jgi:orotate phosphoribosyltransferase
MNTSFIEFLARHEAIRFGEFTLKSGRLSPYFIDMGVLCSGSATAELGRHYAAKITELFGSNFDVVFGPAYKAIPLAISTVIALSSMGHDKCWLFDRKEVKVHGADANSVFVGGQHLDHGKRVVIVDDVFTTGGTKYDAIEKLQKALKAKVVGVVIGVDRMEIGRRINALEEFTVATGVPVYPITDIHCIFTHLRSRPVDGKVYVSDRTYQAYQYYRGEYGVRI